jgi:O-6-methylguanine DNA methyltransferase
MYVVTKIKCTMARKVQPVLHVERLIEIVSSPVGEIMVVASDFGVEAVEFLSDHKADMYTTCNSTTQPMQHTTSVRHEILTQATQQINQYFAGQRTDFSLPLHMHGTDFQQCAWNALTHIPFGSTWTYAQQAREIGRPTAVRAIGAANGRNPIAIVVPCHRVIGADGSLTGYAGGIERKKWLLQHEHDLSQNTNR